MQIIDFIYTYYSVFLFCLYTMGISFVVAKKIKLDSEKNMFFYFFANFLYVIVISCTEFNVLLKLLMTGVYAYFVVYLYDVLRSIKFMINNNLINKYKYFFYFMIFFVVNFIINFPEEINKWAAPWYGLNYSVGVGPRIFIGSFLHLFFNGFVVKETAFAFCVLSYLLLAGILSFSFNILIKKVNHNYIYAMSFLILIYIASPFCINSYLSNRNFGRPEMHTFLLMMVSVFIFFSLQNKHLKYFFITILTCISSAIYQGYIFLYYPIVFATIIISLFENKKRNYIDRIGLIFNFTFSVVSFICFQFFSYVNFDNITDFTNALTQMTDLPFYNEAIYYELFQPFVNNYKHFYLPYIEKNLPFKELYITLLMLLPIIILLSYMFRLAWNNSKNTNLLRNKYFYCFIGNLLILPQFVFNIDWGRWLLALGNVVFFEIFLLIYVKDKGILKALSIVNDFVKKNNLLCFLLIIYFARIKTFGTTNMLLDAALLVSRFWN